ncbi:Inherit from NOG: allene oxide cyclase [Seminavis robusta]|uniref:Inherit from NOG: allene oxide cyclase n=1 Tax=Seminavis robusta TaxID=568900 RepID=A0A9N8E580_9STRA|nr:Inherit from NOG: allene oxide cyclase [Seminavis robusta]|eukprot:Sro684_g186740.1 Inherit from NOG: allene oxide cyclase (194) ;mRNA; r:16916-17664
MPSPLHLILGACSMHLTLTLALTLLGLGTTVQAAGLESGTTPTIAVSISDVITTLRDGVEGVGDVYTWDRRNPIYKEDTMIGDNEGHYIRLTNEGDDSEWDCVFTAFFEDGQIHGVGPFNSGETQMAVSGGTGKYVGAVGSLGLSFADFVNADGSPNATGLYYAYNYVFDLELAEDLMESDVHENSEDRLRRG